jgi:hypothetical protein
VVTTVNQRTPDVPVETYDIKLLSGVSAFKVEGVADKLEHRVASVSYRLSEDEAWKAGVVVKHHLSMFPETETFDIELKDGTEAKGVKKGKNFKVHP